jgi:hypothetical protein
MFHVYFVVMAFILSGFFFFALSVTVPNLSFMSFSRQLCWVLLFLMHRHYADCSVCLVHFL